MRLLAVIPARLGATRLPGKPLRLVGGAPLVVRVLERVVAADVADRCVVATDDVQVRDAVRAAGGDAVLTRAGHPSGTDRVAEVAARAEFADYGAVLNVQGDEPFVSDEALAAAARSVLHDGFAVGTIATCADDAAMTSPNVVKVVVDQAGRALYFSRAPIPWLREPDAGADRMLRASIARRHIGVYAYTRDALMRWVSLPEHPLEQVERLEQLRPLAHGIAIGVAHVNVAPPEGVDTEDDLTRANARWDAMHGDRMVGQASDPSASNAAVATAGGAAPHSAAAAPSPETVA